MQSPQRKMEFFGFVEDMNFVSEDKVGFPAVKSRIWPRILEQAKIKVREEYDEDDNRSNVLQRIDCLHTLGTARASGGGVGVKVFRQVNEYIVRSEMSAAINHLMSGKVNRLSNKRDFQGLGACYGKIFFSMHVSESRLVNRMPVIFLAEFLQMVNSDPACLSSTWWKDEKLCFKKLGVAVKKICSERVRKGEKLFINHFAKDFCRRYCADQLPYR